MILKNLKDEYPNGNYLVISLGTDLGATFACYITKENEYFIVPVEAGHTLKNAEKKKAGKIFFQEKAF